jgi:hypothetical protein
MSFMDRLVAAKVEASATTHKLAPYAAHSVPAHKRTTTCRRCHASFVKDGPDDHDKACVSHRGLYVCQFHPNNAAASGDGLGYYGNGPDGDGWPAKFWDCCGAEDEATPGCVARPHASYDDDDDDWRPPGAK